MKLPSVGELINARYRLDETIGAGGFATVYRAFDVAERRDVAIKVLRPSDGGYDGSMVPRFKREARALAELHSPHTIQLLDSGQTDGGLLFMVFELLPGADLDDYLTEHGALGEDACVHVLQQVLISLSEAHNLGVLHRDIKPANIRIFERDGDRWRVKLMDFGITRPMGADVTRITQTGSVIGTPRYMPPEQLLGIELTPASDIYSLGVVAYEMLSGQRVPRQHLMGDVDLDVPASPPIAAVVHRMLSRDMDERPQSAEAVQRLLTGAPETQPRAAPISRERRTELTSGTPQRGRFVWVFALVAVLVTSAAAILLTRRSAEITPPPADRVRLALRSTQNVAVVDDPTPTPPLTADVGAVDVGRAQAASGCGHPQQTGDVTSRGTSAFGTESWLSYIPRGYDGLTPRPMIVFLHGGGMSAKEALARNELRRLADEHGVIIAAPDSGAAWGWRSDAPVEMFRTINDQMQRDYCIDPDRVFLQSHEVGGLPAMVLACEPWVKAVATTSFRTDGTTFRCERPVPYIAFSPTATRHLPLDGGPSCTGNDVLKLDDYEASWRQRNACSDRPKRRKLAHGRCTEWSCDTPFVSCVVNGGLGWPGTGPRAFDLFGCDGEPTEFDYLTTIWDFFASTAANH